MIRAIYEVTALLAAPYTSALATRLPMIWNTLSASTFNTPSEADVKKPYSAAGFGSSFGGGNDDALESIDAMRRSFWFASHRLYF
jgi:hypothetical protein